MTPASDELELRPHFERLLAEACRRPGDWAGVTLRSGWSFLVLCAANGHHAFRFTITQVAEVEYLAFLAEARRLAALLGASAWKIDKSQRSTVFEVSFISPEPIRAFSKERTA